MTKVTLFLLSIIISIGVLAQPSEKSLNSNEFRECGESEAVERMKTEDPLRYQIYLESRTILEQETANSNQRSETVYTIPVVFHVLHNNGVENISDEQIHDALFILNRDFRKENDDVNSVYNTFLPIAADAKIEFALARIAPNGYCFDGITRTTSIETENGNSGLDQVNAIVAGNDIYQGIWPHGKYLNIYVCKDIGGFAGYTWKPNGNSIPSIANMRYNGIFLQHTYCGSIGTGSVYRSRTLTHEVGHWLNLSHVWGDGNTAELNCGDDFVSDTPITKGFSSCPTSPNAAKVCVPSIVENYENYMDYTKCSKMFTEGQSARMRSALVSSVAGRYNLSTTTNLNEAGVLVSPLSICHAEIEAQATELCKGDSTTFSLTNISLPISSYSWSFPGGTPSISSEENPTITYSTPGVYTVSVEITTAVSSNRVITNTSYITVLASTIHSLPISEGFEGQQFPPIGWTINNGGQPSTWEKSNKGNYPTPNSSANLEFYTNVYNAGDIDDLEAPAFSLNGYSSALLTFDVAYRKWSDDYSDKLEVLISPECGMPYQVVYSKENPDLQTEPDGDGYTNPTVWRNDTIDLTPFIGNSEVKVKFRGISGWGNSIYIDNINIKGGSSYFTSSTNITCTEEIVTFTSLATGVTSWNWDFGADASPATAIGEGPHNVSYATQGNKTVSLSLDNGPASSLNIEVNARPHVTIGVFPSPCVNANSFVLNQGSPSGGIYNGVGISGNQFDPSVAGIGEHIITYTYIDPFTGCSKSDQRKLIVDGCLGINDENATSFILFPNPTTGNVTLSSSLLITEVTVLDNAGRIVQKVQPKNSKLIHLDLSNLSSGLYIIQTEIEGSRHMNKIIVE